MNRQFRPSTQLGNPGYRVSMKAVIKDDSGATLFVRESGSDWILPGGGVEFGELPAEALDRELYEELGIRGATVIRILGVDTFFASWRGAWVCWVVCEVSVPVGTVLRKGAQISDARYMQVSDYSPSSDVSYELARKWAEAA